MTQLSFKTPFVLGLVLLLPVLTACGKNPDGEACADPSPAGGETAKTAGEAAAASKPAPLVMDAKDIMWCRSCVVGPAGYMSCQTVRQATTAETKNALREKARLAACKDAGFAEGQCPGSGVISLLCKGDPPPADETAAGKAMLNALKGSGPLVLTKDGKTVPNIMHGKQAGPGAPPPKTDDSKTEGEKSAEDKAPVPHIE